MARNISVRLRRKSGAPPRVSVRPQIANEEETSVCPVCGGEVSYVYKHRETNLGHSMVRNGLCCGTCGIKFEFMPPKNLKKLNT